MLKISLEKDQNVFFTSDTHYGHTNIVRGITKWRDSKGNIPNNVRNFDTLEQMNETLINNINYKINPNDILIHLGDWSFGGFDNIIKFRDRISCKNVYIICGNHDHHIVNNKNNVRSIFKGVFEYYTQLEVISNSRDLITGSKITVVDKFILCHFPIASWEDMAKGRIHLHGHVHLLPKDRIGQGKSLDVGVDGNNLDPISLKEIHKLMKLQPIKPLVLPSDHHADEWKEVN